MSAKKLKKVFQEHLHALEDRLSALEARLYHSFERGIEIVETQINQFIAHQLKATDAEVVVSEEKSKKKNKKSKEAAPKAEENNNPDTSSDTIVAEAVVAEPVKEKKPRKPYTKKADKPAVEEIVYPAENLRHLHRIGDTLAVKLGDFGVHNVYDLVKLSQGEIEQINEHIKGFAKKMETFAWKAQAQLIIDTLESN